MKPKIIIDDKIPFLEGRINPQEADLVIMPGFDISAEDVRDADALLVRTRTKCNESLLKDSSVRYIATATIGKDHIDIPWCESNGIEVTNSAGCNAPGVAQYVWSTLLRTGFNPEKDTLGIIGYGNIGRIVGEMAEKLGAKVLVNDPPRQEAGMTDLHYVDLDVLLANSDAVTLHVPLTRTGPYKTFHMIGEREFDLMKPEAIMINASRGGVVEEKDWINAIRRKGIKAIVDVWEGEPVINRTLLENAVIATTHIAGYSLEGKSRASRMVLEFISDKLGIDVDLNGLQPAYQPTNEPLTTDRIIGSYDPTEMDRQLRATPENFEEMRETYRYRKEL